MFQKTKNKQIIIIIIIIIIMFIEITENLSKFWLFTENYVSFRCELTPRLKYIVR